MRQEAIPPQNRNPHDDGDNIAECDGDIKNGENDKDIHPVWSGELIGHGLYK